MSGFPDTFVKMMLTLEKTYDLLDEKDKRIFRRTIHKAIADTPSITQNTMLQYVYNFMIDHRLEITRATRKAMGMEITVNGQTIKGNGSSGSGSGGSSGPAPSTPLGGGTPQTPQTPPASAHSGHIRISNLSAKAVYDRGAKRRGIDDARDIHMRSGTEFMAGQMTTNALAAAAQASAGMAL